MSPASVHDAFNNHCSETCGTHHGQMHLRN